MRGIQLRESRENVPPCNVLVSKEAERGEKSHEERMRAQRGRIDKIRIQERRTNTFLYSQVLVPLTRLRTRHPYLHAGNDLGLPLKIPADKPSEAYSPPTHRPLVHLIG